MWIPINPKSFLDDDDEDELPRQRRRKDKQTYEEEEEEVIMNTSFPDCVRLFVCLMTFLES